MRNHATCRPVLRLSVIAVLAGAVFAPAAPTKTAKEKEPIDEAKAGEAVAIPEGLTMRARLKTITPAEPSVIAWRHGGEALGGKVVRGIFRKAGAGGDPEANALAIGEWSAPLPVASIAARFPKKLFLTVTGGSPGKTENRRAQLRTGGSTNALFEFEFSWQGKVLKTFTEAGPDGGSATIVIPAYRLADGAKPDSPEFLNDLTGILEYATRRADWLEKLPWADWPLPTKYALVNNIGGYGHGSGYGVRTTNEAVRRAEMRSLHQLGVNGFRGSPEKVTEILRNDATPDLKWDRMMMIDAMGFPVAKYRKDRKSDPQAGCPCADSIPADTAELVNSSLETALAQPVGEVWALTVDEIGAAADKSPEGKAHLSVCPRCIRAFQEWLKAKGLKPSDFGKSDWAEVKPLNVWIKEGDRPWMNDKGAALAAYYTLAFNNHATAKLFTPLRDAFAKANEAKRQALARGEKDSPATRQPWVYSYALRGNTFLMKGHSLDFFDFYREADNGIAYETSNREPRVWEWDSYLCDVQRVVGAEMNVAQGIYIKPHRGAPLQRMLSAISRGDTMLYWYTYGPDYAKGDSFSQEPAALELTSKAAHLLGRAEEAVYGSRWAKPAEVAVVKPETTHRWMLLSGATPNLMAAWENAKWVYTALQHAHVPVDPIDEAMLATTDLSRYKIIYVSGTHMTRAAAEGLEKYVRNGGGLYTSGWGLARDEANQPLGVLEPVLGLEGRADPEMWYRVTLYGATELESYSDPANQLSPVPKGAEIRGGDALKGVLMPVIGRELLKPASETETLASFADGSTAVTRHKYGKGEAWVVGFFPGLEYSAGVRRPDYDVRRDFDAVRRQFVAAPALALTKPVVDASDPLVEGVLLVNKENGLRAVTLANWAYGMAGSRRDSRGKDKPVANILPVENLKLTIRGSGQVREVKSCMLGEPLQFSEAGDAVVVAVPRIEEGDVLVVK